MTKKNGAKETKAHNIKVHSSARHLAMVGCILIGVFVYAGWRVKTKRNKPQNHITAAATSVVPTETVKSTSLRSIATTDRNNFNPSEVLADFNNPTNNSATENIEPAGSSEKVLHIQSTRISDIEQPESKTEEQLLVQTQSFDTQPAPAIGGEAALNIAPIIDEPQPAEAPAVTEPTTVNKERTEETTNTAGLYTVRAGDTLSSIALVVFNDRARAKDIFQYNRDLMRSPDQLRVGMQLKLSAQNNVTPTIIHTIRKSDSLPSLAMKYYGTANKKYIDQIREKNPALKYGGFKEGVKLIIPPACNIEPNTTTAMAASSNFYTVQSGDTLTKISKKVYSSPSRWSEIFKANRDKMSSPNKLRVGMKLRLP